MQKRVRRSVVFLLVFALLFANFTSASKAFASETDSAEANLSEEPADKQEEAVENGNGENEEIANSVEDDNEKDGEAGEKDADDSVKENEEPGTSKEDEADTGKSNDGTDDKDTGEQVPAAESSEQMKNEKQLEKAENDADTTTVQKKRAGAAAETIELTVVYTMVFGYEENTATYGVQLWHEDDGLESPLANYAIPDTDYVTDDKGYVEISISSTTDNNGNYLTIKIPEGTRYTVEQKSNSNQNVDLSYIYSSEDSGRVEEAEGVLTSNTYCQFYNIMKQRVKVAKTDQNGEYVSGVELQIVDNNGNVIKEWTTTGKEDEIYLLPATDSSEFNTPYSYYLKEVSYPDTIVGGAADIQFRPLPSSPLSEDGQLIQYYADNNKWEAVSKLSMTNIDKTKLHNLTVQTVYDDNGTKAVLSTKNGSENFGVQVLIKNLPLEYMNAGMDIDEAYVTSFGSSTIVDWASATRPSEKSTHIDNSSSEYSKQFFRRNSGEQTCYTSFIVWLRYDGTFTLHGLPDGAEYEVKEVNIYNNNIPPSSPYGYFDIEADENAKGTIAEADASTTIKNILRTINLTVSKDEVFGYDDGRPFFLVFRSAINGMYETFNQKFVDRNGVEREFFYQRQYHYTGGYTPYTYGLIPFRPEDGELTIKLPTAVHWFIDEYNSNFTKNLDDFTYEDLLDDVFARIDNPEDLLSHGNSEQVTGYRMVYWATTSGSNRRTDFILRYKNASRMIAFQKVDESGTPVSGAKMQILDKESGEVLDEWESDSENPHRWNMGTMSPYFDRYHPEVHPFIPDKVYILRETEAPTGYSTAEDIEFKIAKQEGSTIDYEDDGSENGTADYFYPYIDLGDGKETLVLQMADDFEGHDVEISKQDINGDEIAGAQMKITGKVSGASEEITPIEWTSEEGKTKTVNLKPGTYTLEEKAVPDSNVYVLATDITFTVDVDGNVTVNGESVDKITMVDEYAPHDVVISKTDIGGKEIAGAVITISGQEDGASEEMEEITFTTDGVAPYKVALKPGTYTMTEVTAPDGYEKAESINFTVDKDGVVKVDGKEVTDSTVTMVDEHSTHVVKISKTDVGGKEIAGAVLVITGREEGSNKDIEEIRFTTDGKNPHEVELKPGTYTLIETTAPDGYEKAESITFTISVDGTVKVADKDVEGKVTMVDKEKTTTKTTTTKSKGGRTGDESGVMMAITVFAVAAVGLAATLIRRRRRS